MLRKVVLSFGIVLLLAIVIGFFLPSHWHVERQITVSARPETVFEYVVKLDKWDSWTPWTTLSDPSMQRTISGTDGNVGATLTWKGQRIGNGKIVLTGIDPNTRVSYDLYFDDVKTPGKGEIVLQPTEAGTQVKWTDDGQVGSSPVARYFVPRIEQMIAHDFDLGLQRLKKAVEANIAASSSVPMERSEIMEGGLPPR